MPKHTEYPPTLIMALGRVEHNIPWFLVARCTPKHYDAFFGDTLLQIIGIKLEKFQELSLETLCLKPTRYGASFSSIYRITWSLDPTTNVRIQKQS